MKFSMIVTITSCAPNLALSTPGTAPTSSAAERRRDDADREREQRGDAGGQQQPHERRAESARRELALGADVEQSRAQAERDGEPGEDERRRLVEHLPEAVRVAPRAFEQQPIDGARRLAEAQDQQVADDGATSSATSGGRIASSSALGATRGWSWRPRSAGRHRRRIRSRVMPPLRAGHVRAEHVRRSPRLRGRTATNLPPYITAMRSDSASTSASSAETSRIALPCVARVAKLRVDELDRADVDAARRLRGEQHLEVARHLARDRRSSAGCRPRARAPARCGSAGGCRTLRSCSRAFA